MEIISYFKDNSNSSILINVLSVLMKRVLMELRSSNLDRKNSVTIIFFLDKLRITFQ